MARTAIRLWPRWLTPRRQSTISLCLFGAWCIGQIFLDRTWLTGLAFYVPSPIMLVTLLVTAARCRRMDQTANIQKTGQVSLIAAIPVLLVILGWENHFLEKPRTSHVANPNQTASQYQTLVHWNVCSGQLGWKRVLKTLNEQQADIYILSEQPHPQKVNAWIENDLGESFRAEWFHKMVVLSKGQIREPKWLVNDEESLIGFFYWEYNGSQTGIFVVDLISDIDKHRDPILAQLNRLIEEYKPGIIVGDFNAPRRSRQLQASNLPTGYKHAYNLVGGEHGYTWPVPLPVYAIDHCIVAPSVQVGDYDLQTSFSDHRLQRLTFLTTNRAPLESSSSTNP